MSRLTDSPAWKALAAHRDRIAAVSLGEMFASDGSRAARFSLEFGDLLLDFSKQRVDAEALRLLFALAAQAQVPAWIARMFAGEPVNNTEGRAALHAALRSDSAEFPPGRNVMPAVHAARDQMRRFVEEVRGSGIADVVNIGIGGSDLGPRMLVRALRGICRAAPRLHFVANVDPADLEGALQGLNPRTTLFIVASKTFTTAETLANAARARRWLEAGLGAPADVPGHFAAVTANTAGAVAFGVPAARVFPLWDWVGGRYSVWSAVGLPVALACGMEAFEELLEGARAVDAHFHTTAMERNLPAVLALLEIWNVNFLGAASRAVLPYSEDLRELPAYLQQLEMESNGKRTDREGNEVDYATAPVVWGAAGTPSQHSFHQLLHQGTPLVPVDFVVVAGGDRALAANALAQSAALAFGHAAPGAPHRSLPGNRPSNTLLLARLDPHALGQLIALHEHKTFVQGVIWNIDSFDQWGVERGKTLAHALLGSGAEAGPDDASTRALLRRLRD
jgi:glucose-6-phosphate isomerase